MSLYKIFHNPRCSKSRQTLQLLKDNNCKIEIISYLEIDLKVSLIKDILKKLTLKPRDILRKGEQEYKDNNLKKDNLSEEDLINYMIKYPKLIERPIVVKGDKAVIGRPPEKVLELVEAKKITAGHAKILVGLENALFLANKIIEKKLSVRQTENFVKIFKKGNKKRNQSKDPNISDLENFI